MPPNDGRLLALIPMPTDDVGEGGIGQEQFGPWLSFGPFVNPRNEHVGLGPVTSDAT